MQRIAQPQIMTLPPAAAIRLSLLFASASPFFFALNDSVHAPRPLSEIPAHIQHAKRQRKSLGGQLQGLLPDVGAEEQRRQGVVDDDACRSPRSPPFSSRRRAASHFLCKARRWHAHDCSFQPEGGNGLPRSCVVRACAWSHRSGRL